MPDLGGRYGLPQIFVEIFEIKRRLIKKKRVMKNKVIRVLSFIGLGFLEPAIRLASGEEPKKNAMEFVKKIILPIITIVVFMVTWSKGAEALENREREYKLEQAFASGGEQAVNELKACFEANGSSCQITALPTPSAVYNAFNKLIADHKVISEKKEAFIEKTAALNEARIANGEEPIVYTGRPSFVDQINRSIKTVFAGFFLALFLAVPIGIVLGLSEQLRASFNWLIQIFKPVSPVVWYLLVYMIVKTFTLGFDGDTSFIISFIAVGLCAMWATLVNTTLGVSSVDKDFINVAKVLNLSTLQKIFKIILPSSFPLIFTGLRITLSVAWMVLIAIELLSQSPGLGTFVWEEFQNGAADSNAKIIAAMFVIGGIGFLLDRLMFTIQQLMTFTEE